MTASLIPKHRSLHQSQNEIDGVVTPLHQKEEKSYLQLVAPQGQLHVHSAPYRGSFAKVLSEAIRTAGLGRQVMVAQFLKGGVNQGPKGVVRLCGRLEWLRPDTSFCNSSKDFESNPSSPEKPIQEIWQICKDRLLKGDLDQVVLDEVGLAIEMGFIKEKDVISTLEKRPIGMDIILTGPSIPSGLISMADQVTELRCGF